MSSLPRIYRVAICHFVLATNLFAAAPYLVKDIEQSGSGGGSSPVPIASGPLGTFFSADLPGQGSELWVTDGTETGTRIVREIRAGIAGSAPGPGATLPSGTLLFAADDGVHGRELWRSDGTSSGTEMVKEFNDGLSGGLPHHFASHAGFVYFIGGNVSNLWRTDGTEAGTIQAIRSGSITDVEEFAFIGNLVIVAGRRASGGTQGVFSSAGPNQDPTQLSGLVQAQLDSAVEMAGSLYFIGSGGLWRTDGTNSGTRKIKSFSTDAIETQRKRIARAGNRIVFAAEDLTVGTELWVSDGTSAGTALLKDISAGSDGGAPRSSDPASMVSVGDRVIFAARTAENGRELWVTDGTSTGTRILADIWSGPPSTFDSFNPAITTLNGVAYFAADDRIHGIELWRSDGSPEGTYLLKDLAPDDAVIVSVPRSGEPKNFLESDGKLFFAARDATHGVELWRTDGVLTEMVRDLNVTTGSSVPRNLFATGGKVYFTVNTLDVDAHDVPWQSDGTASGTFPLSNASTGQLSGAKPLADCGGFVYFSACNADVGCELWRTDGYANGAVLVQDQPFVYGMPYAAACAGRKLVYLTPSESGVALHVTEGSPDNTFTLQRAHDAGGLITWGSSAVFAVYNEENVEWRITDGTVAGTRTILSGSMVPIPMIAIGDRLFFHTGSAVPDLWVTDGTQAGTIKVGEFPDTNRYAFTTMGSTLFLIVGPADRGALWKSDGTLAGTKRIASVFINEPDPEIVAFKGRLYFPAYSFGGAATQLWVSDGTDSGTHQMVAIGEGGANPRNLVEFGDSLYFTATLFRGNGEGLGNELWVTDGSPEGTHIVADLNVGGDGSNPHDLVASENMLYFGAFTPQYGDELWALRKESTRRRSVRH